MSGKSTRTLTRFLPEVFARRSAHRLTLALRSSRYAALFEISENAALREVIEHDPTDQQRHNEQGHRISGDNEIGVRPENSCVQFLRLDQSHAAHAAAKDFIAHNSQVQSHEQERERQCHDQQGCQDCRIDR